VRRAGILAVLVCVLACVDAHATTAVQVTMEEQVASARAIVRGRCTKIESRMVGGRIFTYVTLDVSEVLKGDAAPGRLVIKQAGGAVGNLGEWITGSPRFDVGRESVVFLASDGGGAYVVDGLFMGNFFVDEGLDGRTWLRRDSGGEGVLVVARDAEAAAVYTDELPLDDVRATVRREAAKSTLSDDDLIAQVPAEYDRPYEGESEVVPSFTLLYNQRWFEPDSGATVPFHVNPNNFDENGTSQQLESAVVDALNAWSTIDGCSMRFSYAGVDANGCGWGPTDGVSRVSVDCRGEISGAGCRSIIAIGGGHYRRDQTVVVNGTTFYRIFEADVVLNDGFCDLFQNGTSLREVLAHELGHCIGLGHSADRTATMAAYVHNDDRGATLQPDDRDGARFIYPGDDGGGGGGGGGGEEPEPPVIMTTGLPEGRVGETYLSSFEVANGSEPFAWTLTSGQLPPGVALSASGAVGGAPTVAGTYAFSVRVSDSLGRVDGRFFSIRVRPPLPVVQIAEYRSVKKRLTIAGLHFAANAQFEINGQVVVPRKPPVFNTTAGAFEIKGTRKQLRLNRGRGTNSIVVVVDGERSAPFSF
jgi:hypothetical protein